MFFKVGDTPTVRNDLVCDTRYYMESRDNWDTFVDEMRIWTGKKVTIADISDTGKYYITEDCDGVKWCWTDEMFEEYAC